MQRLGLALSAQQILFYYCGRADQDTGETIVSPERTAQDLGIRKDHVNEHDRKLVRMKFIAIDPAPSGGRVVRLLSPWQPRAKRTGYSAQPPAKKATSQVLGKAEEVKTQNLGSPLIASPSFGEPAQVLGNSQTSANKATSQVLGKDLKDFPSFGESTQVLGKSTQVLGAHIGITSSCNQERERALWDPPFAPESPETLSDTSGEQKPEPTQAAPPPVTPFDVFKREFPDQATIHAETVIEAAGIANVVIWQATLNAWKVNRWSARNLAGMLESYHERAKRAQQQPTTTRAAPKEPTAADYALPSAHPLPNKPRTNTANISLANYRPIQRREIQQVDDSIPF